MNQADELCLNKRRYERRNDHPTMVKRESFFKWISVVGATFSSVSSQLFCCNVLRHFLNHSETMKGFQTRYADDLMYLTVEDIEKERCNNSCFICHLLTKLKVFQNRR